MSALGQQARSLADRAAVSLKWLATIVPMAMAVGSACAFFLWSLERVGEIRFDHPWLLFLLPVGGLGVPFVSLLRTIGGGGE
jgi:hypothetical protein